MSGALLRRADICAEQTPWYTSTRSRRDAQRPSHQTEDYVTLKVGEPAPGFDVIGQQAGKTRRLRLEDFRGNKNVVLYFYPRDFTPVCTKEACGFRDLYEELASKDTEVIGVSVDDDASHARFAQKHAVTFPLVSDPNKALAREYRATSLLRDLIGSTKRVTYVIDKRGVIVAVLTSELSAQSHIDGVKTALAALG
jgi:thioredoxin-dependent peroxiredoxin